MNIGTPLDEDQHAMLAGRVKAVGTGAVAKDFGVSTASIRAALLGAGLTAGVRTLIEMGLDRGPALPSPPAGHGVRLADGTYQKDGAAYDPLDQYTREGLAPEHEALRQCHVALMVEVVNARRAAQAASSAAAFARRTARAAEKMAAATARHLGQLSKRAATTTPAKKKGKRGRRSPRTGIRSKSADSGEPPSEPDSDPPGRAA